MSDAENIASVPDEELWAMRGRGRERVVRIARARLATQLRERGFALEAVRTADIVLDRERLDVGLCASVHGIQAA